MTIRGVFWIAGQAFSGFGYNLPISIGLIVLVLLAATSDLRKGRFVRDRRLWLLSLPVLAVLALLITGAVFERMPRLVFLPYLEMILCVIFAGIAVWRCRVMWRTSAALSAFLLYFGFWCWFVSVMSITGDWL
jgi:hypothetical protein